MAKESNDSINNLNIPKGWKYLPFGNVFEFIPTLSLSREQLTKDEETSESIYNIHYGDIHATYNANVLDFDKELRIPKIKDVADLKLNILKEGDLAIADASEDYAGVAACIELVNIKKRTVTGGLHTFIARDNSGLTVQGFRTYALKNPIVSIELKKLATGSKVYGISKTNLATLNLLLPPTKEQTKIAQILSTWDVAIEALQLLIAKKERRKKALMQKLLTGKKRFKEFKGEKWKDYKIKELFEIKAGKDMDTQNFSKERKTTYQFPVYSNSLDKNGEYGYYNYYEFESGQITVTARGNIGQANPRFENFNAIGRLLILKPIEDVDIKFITEIINFTLHIHIESNAIPQLTAPQFGACKIKVPYFKEQQKIASVLSAADEEIQTLKIQLAHYQKQKQGLMQVLLTGKKRVKI